jgi:hypothetical protein
MARISFPYKQVVRELGKLKIMPERFGYYRFNHYRAYKRVDGKFIPYGYNIVSRSNSVEQYNVTLLDSDVK